MEFKHTMEFETTEEINETFSGGNKQLSDLIVDTILEELESDIQEIPIVSLTTKDDELIYEITANRDDLVETLEQNLDTMEDYEDYEEVIPNALPYLGSWKRNIFSRSLTSFPNTNTSEMINEFVIGLPFDEALEAAQSAADAIMSEAGYY